MEKIETVGQLRKVITASNGELIIGKFKLKYNESENSDIDIYFESDLVQWYGSSLTDEVNLQEEGMYSVSSVISESREKNERHVQKNRELEERVAELEKDNIRLKNQGTDNVLAQGKVIAYEKILFDIPKMTIENPVLKD